MPIRQITRESEASLIVPEVQCDTMNRMPSTRFFHEDRLPLFWDNSKDHVSHSYVDKPIIKGVANQLKKWPDNLCVSLWTGCLVISGLASLIFVTVIAYSPVASGNNYCEMWNFGDDNSYNVYFVKEDSRMWSKEEFCYIEATAREYPDLNVHLINLLRNSNVFNMPKVHFKDILATKHANIHASDISVDEFFSRSKLSNIATNLNNELLIMAAKAYLLWNSPGVAMDPESYCGLSKITEILCQKGKRNCTPNKSTTIDLAMNLQATEVHCQTFFGFLLQEISRNTTQIFNMEDALDKFCSRIDKCPEVRISDLKRKCSINIHKCPTIYSTETL